MTAVLRAQLIEITINLQFTLSFPSTQLFSFCFDWKDEQHSHSISFNDDIYSSEKVGYLRRSPDI